MRLFPGVNGTTLDSFNKDVYRPRLALLLLIILLIFGQHEAIRSTGQDTVKATKLTVDRNMRLVGKSKSAQVAAKVQALLDKLPGSLGNDGSAVAVRYVKSGAASSSQSDEPSADLQRARAKVDKTMAEVKRANSKAPRKGKDTAASIVNRALNAEALSAIVALHALWIIRLASMVIEDHIGRENLSAKDRRRPSSRRGTVLAVLALSLSTALALVAATSSWIEQLERWGIATSLGASSVSLLPVQAIIYLELCATLASLAGPFCRLNDAHGERSVLPRKVSLPSPSHSPSLVDLLPIPRGLTEAFRARAATPATTPSFRSRQRITAHWTNPNLADRPLIAVPGAPPRRDAPLQAEDRPVMALRPVATPSMTLADPLRLPTTGKAPRLEGVRVRVDTTWFVENVVTLFGHLIGVLQYVIITISLPTLAPTSFPSLLSLLSLRSELGAVTSTWSSSRKSIECLEFVRRRWRAQPKAGKDSNDDQEDDEMLCPICFECVETSCLERSQDVIEDHCTLDCGHQLHSICLVQWLAKQAFCPCCHATLRATPPNVRSESDTRTNASTENGVAAAN